MKVIIVDNEQEVTEHLQRQMKQVPEISKTTVFTDPLEALEHAGRQTVDVAFLDIEMPKMAGIELAKRLKAVNMKTNIVFITGYSQYAIEAFTLDASDYLLKPTTPERIGEALKRLRNPVLPVKSRVWIQTFGHFEVFVDRKPLKISSAKAKELLAYLVDRRGATLTTKRIAAVLWEEKNYDRQVLKQTQKTISQLKTVLNDAGIEDIIIKGWNSIAVDVDKFDCDYYQLLEDNLTALNTYTGEYMTEYSWAEYTAGMLIFKNN